MSTQPRSTTRRRRRLALVGLVAAGLLMGPIAGVGPSAGALEVEEGGFRSLEPHRVCDTRVNSVPDTATNQCNNGGAGAKLNAGQSMTVDVVTDDGVPATADSVVLNVTATNATAATFVTAWPAGEPRPLASNINVAAGQTVPNLVHVPVVDGEVSIYNNAGSVDIIVDVEGYTDDELPEAGEYNPVTPARICDTRIGNTVADNQCNGNGSTTGRLGPTGSRTVRVTGLGGIPSAGVAAVVLNVTVTGTSAPSYLTVFPTGSTQPGASNLNWVAGQTVPNRVIVPLGDGSDVGDDPDSITIYNNAGVTDVIVDVGGWYSTDGTDSGSLYTPLAPERICDTRLNEPGTPVANNPCNNNGSFTGLLGGPDAEIIDAQAPAGATAVVLNVTSTRSTTPSHLRIWDAGTLPTISDLNWPAGRTVANLVVVKVAPNGTFRIYNNAGNVHVVIDLQGYYTASAPPVATDQAVSTPQATPLAIELEAEDPNGDPLTFHDVPDTANGTVTGTAPNITYTPDAGFAGTDTILFSVSDDNGGGDLGAVTVTVTNVVPVATDQSETTGQLVPVDIELDAVDAGGDPLTFAIVQPANGTVVDNEDGTVTYTSDAGYVGDDTFTYTATDDHEGTSNEATVTITVTNVVPVATDQAESTDEDVPVDITLDAVDAGGDPLTFDIVQPANGTVVDNLDGTVTYTPDGGFTGEDTFTYTATDDHAASDTATVTITVSPVVPPVDV